MTTYQCDSMVAQERNIVIVQRVHMHSLKARSEQTHLFKQLNAIAAVAFFYRQYMSRTLVE